MDLSFIKSIHGNVTVSHNINTGIVSFLIILFKNSLKCI